ncbi:MAG: alpha/beta hydrolase family protein [Robiginitalea sp.]
MAIRKRTITVSLLFMFLLMSISSKAQQDSAFIMKPIGIEAFQVMSKFFSYDKNIPLESIIVEQREESEYIREKIVFRGVDDSQVPGYLALPKEGAAPYPCILLLHGLTGSKEIWWNVDRSPGNLVEKLLVSGFAVLSLDAKYHGERIAFNNYESPSIFVFQKGWDIRSNYMTVQSVREYRRAIDYLETRIEIDTGRLGMIGYSMGGFMTFSLTAVDPRVKVSVACVTPNIEEPYSPKAAYHFAPYINNRPFLMLMGKDDPFYTVEEAQQLHNFIDSDVKEITFYNSGHRLPDEWIERATEWMEKYLK